jgi:predicted transcriptional regulator
MNSNWEAELAKITRKGIPIYTYYIEEVSIKNMGEEDKKLWVKDLKETFLKMAVNEGTIQRLSF